METSSENSKQQIKSEKKSRANSEKFIKDLSDYPTFHLMHTLKYRIDLALNKNINQSDQISKGVNKKLTNLIVSIFQACVSIVGDSDASRNLYFRAYHSVQNSKNVQQNIDKWILEAQQQIEQKQSGSLIEIKQQPNIQSLQDPSFQSNQPSSSGSSCQQLSCQLMNKLNCLIAEFEGAQLEQKKLLQERQNCHSSVVDSILETALKFSSQEELKAVREKIYNDTKQKMKENTEGLLKVYNARHELGRASNTFQKKLNKIIFRFSQLDSDKKLPIQDSKDEEESKLDNQQLMPIQICNEQVYQELVHQENVDPQTISDDEQEFINCQQAILDDATTFQPQDQYYQNQEETKE